jgi:hypothetical protein
LILRPAPPQSGHPHVATPQRLALLIKQHCAFHAHFHRMGLPPFDTLGMFNERGRQLFCRLDKKIRGGMLPRCFRVHAEAANADAAAAKTSGKSAAFPLIDAITVRAIAAAGKVRANASLRLDQARAPSCARQPAEKSGPDRAVSSGCHRAQCAGGTLRAAPSYGFGRP